jgi:Reductase C-terminal
MLTGPPDFESTFDGLCWRCCGTHTAGSPRHAQTTDEVPYFWSHQYDVKPQIQGIPTDYDAVQIVEGDAEGWEFVTAYGCEVRTIAVLGTIPDAVYAYRDAIADRVGFPAEAGKLARSVARLRLNRPLAMTRNRGRAVMTLTKQIRMRTPAQHRIPPAQCLCTESACRPGVGGRPSF